MNFKIRLFKEHLNQSFSSFEFKFLIRTFSYASLAFFSFGLWIISLLGINELTKFLESATFQFLGMIATLSSMFFLFINFYKYQQNPLEAKKPFIKKMFFLLVSSYTFIFLNIFSVLGARLNLSDFSSKTMLISFIFFLTALIYLIPAAIGFFTQNHKKILLLSNFLKYCYLIYAFLIIFVLIGVFFLSGGISGNLIILLYLFLGIIIFLSPILTIYKLKSVASHIDYTDEECCYKWEMFFVFEILIQLIQMSLYIARFLLIFLGGGGKR